VASGGGLGVGVPVAVGVGGVVGKRGGVQAGRSPAIASRLQINATNCHGFSLRMLALLIRIEVSIL